MSMATIFGAAALKNVSQGETDRALDLLLEYGVNHVDTAPRYGDAELRIGPWMRAHRADFFLATKTGQRTRAAARDEIRRSLDRLRVDSVDLLQFRRYADRYEDEGLDGLVDKRLGEVSARRAPVDEVVRTEALYRERYDGWNVAHFYSFYRRRHAGERSYSQRTGCFVAASGHPTRGSSWPRIRRSSWRTCFSRSRA